MTKRFHTTVCFYRENPIVYSAQTLCFHQLGTFVVNGEKVCSPFVTKSGPTRAEHGARSQLDRYVLFLVQSLIIKCEIQCINAL